jgi:hypothetical protein
MEMYRFFGPFPASFTEIASETTCQGIDWMEQEIPIEELTPFARISPKEVCSKDRDFILKIMKLDYRDRPTAKELLADQWWNNDESNTT